VPAQELAFLGLAAAEGDPVVDHILGDEQAHGQLFGFHQRLIRGTYNVKAFGLFLKQPHHTLPQAVGDLGEQRH